MSGSRRAGQRFDASMGVTTEALVFLGQLDPEAVGASIEHATHYEPVPVDEFETLLDASPLAPERCTFLDIGSGMGRAVLLAARRPFRQIIGVEISPALHELARENRDLYRGARACRDIRLVRADASDFALPRGELTVFLYNPFDATVLAPLVQRLAERDAPTVIAYHTPVERAALDADARFSIVAEFAFGAVFERV